MCSFGRESYTLFKFAQCLFLVDQFGDVNTSTDIPAEVPARSITRHSLIGNPTILSIVPLQAILHNERLARVERAAVGLQSFLHVLRMKFTPAVAQVLLHAPPCQLYP